MGPHPKSSYPQWTLTLTLTLWGDVAASEGGISGRGYKPPPQIIAFFNLDVLIGGENKIWISTLELDSNAYHTYLITVFIYDCYQYLFVVACVKSHLTHRPSEFRLHYCSWTSTS